MNIYQKLNGARAKFHSLKLTKTGHNKFAGYNYFELGDFLIPALRVFEEVGLLAVVSFEADVARMTIVDTDSEVQDPVRIVITSPMGSAALKGCHEVQNIGAVETYQRRYLWVAALEIVEHDAVDASAGSETPLTVQLEKSIEAAESHSPTRLAFQSLQPEIQAQLRKSAPFITAAMPDAQKALDLIDVTLDNWPDEDRNNLKAGLWYLLDSKTRSAIKRHTQTSALRGMKEAA